jgi:diguanylate cyclase (GGDEF)-like protein
VDLGREMARARRAGESLVLAFVDVDNLKAINDSRGHSAGDRTLVEVVATLRAKLRSYDLIIRFGGDEFLCVIPGVSVDDAADRLAAVNVTLAETTEHASITVGLAGMQADDSVQDLVSRADAALYQQRQ